MQPNIQHYHFTEGSVCFLIEHTPGTPANDIAQVVNQAQFAGLNGAKVATKRVVSFGASVRAAAVSAQAFSLAFATLPPQAHDSAGAATSAKQIEAAHMRRIRALQQEIDNASPHAKGVIRHVTANWLHGACGGNTNSTGGPGARPIPIDTTAVGTLSSSNAQFWRLNISSALLGTRDGTGVTVYVLDTALSSTAIQSAVAQWGSSNPLLNDLLSGSNPIQFVYADPDAFTDEDFYQPEHNYTMSDHGLFVASIIKDIAPNATIKVIEVLNEYGVGSLESIAHGFAIAAADVTENAKVLVNASLVLKVAQPDAAWLEQYAKQDPFWADFPPTEITNLVTPEQRIVALFGGDLPYVKVVAAAGNDNKDTLTERPPARYPAAFEGVLGIGALNHDNLTATTYSNLCDTPVGDGLAVFGGDANGPDADSQHGIIGVYTGPFPSGQQNTTGWARWAGTSFSTPIITGILASKASQGTDVPSSIGQMRAADPGGSNQTAVGEALPAA